jgi:uncharacterized repeat protein (TIGR03803 family)
MVVFLSDNYRRLAWRRRQPISQSAGSLDKTPRPLLRILCGVIAAFVLFTCAGFAQASAHQGLPGPSYSKAVLDSGRTQSCGYPKCYTLSLTVTGQGQIEGGSSSTGAFSCSSTCNILIAAGSTVTISGAAAQGWSLAAYTGACAVYPPTEQCSFTMNANTNAGTTFQQIFLLSAGYSGLGTITSSPSGLSCPSAVDCSGYFPAYSTVELTAVPAAGWYVAGWTQGCSSSSATCNITMSGNEAAFVVFQQTTYSLAVTDSGSGTVTSSPTGINCGSVCSADFASGTQVSLTASPSQGSAFTGWSGACTGTGGCSVTMNVATNVTATFAPLASEKVLYSFKGGSDGADPNSVVALGTTLYGTTSDGGANGVGTVFKVTSKGAEKLLHSFGVGTDGASPMAGLINVGGTLYGTTSAGGTYGFGTVFSITQTGNETVIYSFKGGSDGAKPVTSLVILGGYLYGTTQNGGSSNCPSANGFEGCGTLFKMTTQGAKSLLYTFNGGSDGANPQAPVVNVLGVLYGVTTNGGTGGWGTAFKVTQKGVETVIHTFGLGGGDGVQPQGGLTNVSGLLFGESGGGTNSVGTVFKLSPSGAEAVIYSFSEGVEGWEPGGGLLNLTGTLYGTTRNGGTNGWGTVFSVTQQGAETPLYSFKGGSDGGYPQSGVVSVKGLLYGTTSAGGGTGCGGQGCGTIFEITPD